MHKTNCIEKNPKIYGKSFRKLRGDQKGFSKETFFISVGLKEGIFKKASKSEFLWIFKSHTPEE